MTAKRKKEIRKLFGIFLRKRREEGLNIPSVRQLSFSSSLDGSKLSKIEKGKLDFRFDTLMEIALTYKLKPRDLLDFEIPFWDEEAEKHLND